jgi:hypothetical protein
MPDFLPKINLKEEAYILLHISIVALKRRQWAARWHPVLPDSEKRSG